MLMNTARAWDLSVCCNMAVMRSAAQLRGAPGGYMRARQLSPNAGALSQHAEKSYRHERVRPPRFKARIRRACACLPS